MLGDVYMPQKKPRQSGLELMRIIAMLLIVAHHYVDHGGYALIAPAALRPSSYFLQLIMLFGRPACSLFALTSGYFLIEQREPRTHYRKLGALMGKILIYQLSFLLIYLLYGGQPSTWIVVRSLLPFAIDNWYVRNYMLFYIFLPFFNPLLCKLSRRKYSVLLTTVLGLWMSISLINFAHTPSFVFSKLDGLLFFPAMYLTGAYIRLHLCEHLHYNNRLNLYVALGSTLLLCLGTLAIDLFAKADNSYTVLQKNNILREYNFPLCVLWAVSLFLYFSRLDIHNALIDRIASAMVGVYLIHDHPVARVIIWKGISPNTAYAAWPYLHAPIKITAVFLTCTAIDLLRDATIGRRFDKLFGSVYDRLFAMLDARRARKGSA